VSALLIGCAQVRARASPAICRVGAHRPVSVAWPVAGLPSPTLLWKMEAEGKYMLTAFYRCGMRPTSGL